MYEREEPVAGYRTHWKVDKLTQISHKFRSGEWTYHLINLINIPILERAELDAQDWPVPLGSLKLDVKPFTQPHDVIDFPELVIGISKSQGNLNYKIY